MKDEKELKNERVKDKNGHKNVTEMHDEVL